MRRWHDRSPNQRVERAAADRLGFGTIGFMHIIRYGLGTLSAAVAHSSRSPNQNKPLRTLLLALLLLSVGAAHSPASSLAIDFKADGETVAKIRLRIDGDEAIASVGGETERFNLAAMSWLDSSTGQWVSIEQCKAWADQSKARTSKSTDSAPAGIRPFLTWSLSPSFSVERSSEALRLTSGQVDYVIEGAASTTDVDGYFRYAVINAYKKAMTERKLPPFAELKAIEEMKSLGHIPRIISVTIPGVPGSPAIVLEIRATSESSNKPAPPPPARAP